jgi:chemotaxis protein histidine kinase CheA
MGQVDLNSYKSLYLQTAKERVDSMSLGCSKLSANVQDMEVISEIYLNSHSLKSQSQVMGFVNISNLCATIERTSKDIKNGAAQADNKFIVFLKDSIEKLNLELSQIEEKR